MKLSHYFFGLLCLVAAGLIAAEQGVERYRTGYRVEALLRRRAALEEARERLQVALSAHQRPDRLMETATRMRIPLVEPSLASPTGEPPPEEP